MKNTLVQYKGGGYDGCFWEWNFFMFDSKGTFHNILSTGYKGIKTEPDALNLLSKDSTRSWGSQEYYIYDLTNAESISEFETETAPMLLVPVIGSVNELYSKPIMHWTCECCGSKQSPMKPKPDAYEGAIFHDGYHGNGGVGVEFDGKLCVECYSSGSCGACGEYVGQYDSESNDWPRCAELAEQFEIPVEVVESEREHLEESCSTCHYCLERHLKEIFEKDQ